MEKFYKDRNVLITGGLGFLGSNLALRLDRLGARVTLVDAFLPGHGANWRNIEEIRGSVQVNLCDIRDEHAMARMVADKQTIFHIAGQTSHTDSMTDPFLDIDINCRGNMVFLETVRKHNPEARVVYASTRAIYGAPVTVPVTEAVRPNATDIYGVNKYAGEAYHMIYHRAHGIPITVLRCSNGYGPRAQIEHPKFGILNWFVGLILRNQKIKIFGDGAQLRDYTFADDFIEAFLLAGMKQDALGQVFNIGATTQIRFLDMVKTLIEIAGQGEYELVPWPPEYKKIEVGDFAYDISKAQTVLGWSPSTAFEDGLRKTFDFYRANLEHYLPAE
jgi:UDP-glucose 4-epimerase